MRAWAVIFPKTNVLIVLWMNTMDFHYFFIKNLMCILNGSFESNSNKYTFVSTRCCAVVDYIFVRQNELQFIRNFTIISMCELSDYVVYFVSDNSNIYQTIQYYFVQLRQHIATKFVSMDNIIVYYIKTINWSIKT